MIKSLLLLTYSLCFNAAFCQSQFNEADFEQYTVLNNLSDNNVHSIYQDSLGYLWIATQMGLNNFDGKEFKHFFPDTKPLNVPGTYIVKIAFFSNNRIGIVTRRGLQVVNAKDYSIKNFRFPDTSYFTTYQNALLDAVELPDKSVLLCSRAGVYSFDRSGHINFRFDKYAGTQQEKKPQAYAQFVTVINSHELLIYTTENGLDYYNFHNRQLTHVNSLSKKWANFFPLRIWGSTCANVNPDQFIFLNRYTDSISFIDTRKNRKITTRFPWIGREEFNWESQIFKISDNEFAITCARNGFFLFRVDSVTGVITGDAKKYLPSYKCNCLFIDKEKRLWAGTRTGLLKQRKNSLFINSWLYQKSFERTYNLKFSCAYRYKDKLYVGASNRFEGLLVIDTATMQVVKRLTFYGGNNEWSDIQSLQCYHNDTLWVGTLHGLLWLSVNTWKYGCVLDNKRDTVLPNSLPVLGAPDNTGKAWLFDFMAGKAGYYDTVARTFNFFTAAGKPALPFESIKHIVYDAENNIWIAGHGLARWNRNTNKFDVMMDAYAGANKFNDDIIAITADKQGSLWLFNAENSLLEYRLREKKFYIHGTSEGLPSFVQSMADYANGSLWFTTGSQLLNYNTKTKKIYYFNQSDGLPLERASSRTIFFDKERNCFYSLHNNYLAVFPASLSEKNTTNKKLRITKITFADTTIYNPSGRLSLKYKENNLSLHFTVINYDSPDGYNFSYRVNGKEWINLEGNQVIFFNSLPIGSYRVDIKASGKLGEQYITSIALVILPPFWQTWWFYLVCATAAIAVLYVLYKFRLEQIKRVYHLRMKISRDLHDDIGSTLSGINMYSHLARQQLKTSDINEADKSLNIMQQTSGEMIDKLSDIVWLTNPEHETLKKLAERLENYANDIAAAKNIKVKTSVIANAQQNNLPFEICRNVYLICKEAINNAVKYSEASLLELTVKETDKGLEFSVQDNGKGFNAEMVKRGNGLDNMQKRAAEIGATLIIQSKHNEGSLLSMKIKIPS